MKNNTAIIILVILTIGLLVAQQFIIRKSITPISDDDVIKHITLLESKIDSIKGVRDSLIIVYDTTKVKIIELEKKHETIRDSIISQSVNSDCVVFSEYISNYNNRFTNTNNSKSTEDR